MIHLKEKEYEKFDNRKFAVLVEPTGPRLRSDEEMNTSVAAHGKAVVRPFVGLLCMELGEPVEMTPADFKATWIGD